MQSRLELVLGIDNRVPSSPHAKRIIVSAEESNDGEKGCAVGCLYLDATNKQLYLNVGTEQSAVWVPVNNAAADIAAAAKTATDFIDKGGTLPTKADFVGQLFVRTGNTSPGLYVSTGTTTPGWKAVSHAS